jgi:hypothetical protein
MVISSARGQRSTSLSRRRRSSCASRPVAEKAAIGAALDDPGFDPSTLVYWRRRLAKSAWPHRDRTARCSERYRLSGVRRVNAAFAADPLGSPRDNFRVIFAEY